MTIGIYRHFYLRSSPQHPCLIDDQGNVEQIQIRGTEVVLGDGAIATGSRGVAVGSGAQATGAASVAVGVLTGAFARESIAIGGNSTGSLSESARAFGIRSIAIGFQSFTDTVAVNSIAIGEEAQVFALESMVIGNQIICNSAVPVVEIGMSGAPFLKYTEASRFCRMVNGPATSNAPTAGQLLRGCLVITAQCTLPTAAAIVAAVPDAAVSDAFFVCFVNASAGALDFRGGAPAGITFADAASTIDAHTERTATFFLTNVTPAAEAVTVF